MIKSSAVARMRAALSTQPVSQLGSYTFTVDELLAGSNGDLDDLQQYHAIRNHPVIKHQQQQLKANAELAVAIAQPQLQQLPAPPRGAAVHLDPMDANGIRATKAVDTTYQPNWLLHAGPQGINLFEPFGGLCAGLEMCLRNGYVIRRYYYADTDPAAQAVARHQVNRLAITYPAQLTLDVLLHMFQLPQNVKMITSTHLTAMLQGTEEPWLLVSGWECQDLSPAGSLRGLAGKHSSTYYDLLFIVGAMQQLCGAHRFAYLLENTAISHNFRSPAISQDTYQQIVTALGAPVLVDAARFGAYAHRLRNFWTNLAPTAQLQTVLDVIQRPPGRHVDDISGS